MKNFIIVIFVLYNGVLSDGDSKDKPYKAVGYLPWEKY